MRPSPSMSPVTAAQRPLRTSASARSSLTLSGTICICCCGQDAGFTSSAVSDTRTEQSQRDRNGCSSHPLGQNENDAAYVGCERDEDAGEGNLEPVELPENGEA